MVTRSRSRRGASNLGCLVSLLLTATVIYYAAHIGQVWWRYYELVDRMKTAARFAGNETNEQILKQLQADAREVGVPPAAQQFRITRSDNPRGITITTSYTEPVELPFVHKILSFKPSVTQRL